MLTSTVPSSFWNLKDLLSLDLSDNSLSGFLDQGIGNLVAAIYINLSLNNLSGSIPNTIGKLQNLVDFSLALEGSIPVSMGSMTGLETLDLSYNNLSGSIPKPLEALSSCSNPDFKALVLEYMPNASLEKWLYSHNHFLDARQRLDMMIDVASALEYLHHGYSTSVVHCDLKPSNVLLDEKMIAHVCDFGISKLLGDEESVILTTLGYIAPEYGLEGIVSTRCDVYSYGVMLMETFTRKKPSDVFSGDLSLKSWVESLLPDSPDGVIDANLFIDLGDERGNKFIEYVSSILALALKCSAESPQERINMKEALAELLRIKRLFFQ